VVRMQTLRHFLSSPTGITAASSLGISWCSSMDCIIRESGSVSVAMSSSSLQVNYFPSFQTLSADSSAKFIWNSQQEVRGPPWSAEPLTHQITKKKPPYIYKSSHQDKITV
jgi:hypothetical protein